MDVIDWGLAQRVGELVAGSPSPVARQPIRAEAVEPLAQDFARRVSDYSGLPAPSDLPPLETVDRPAWIAANLRTMRPLLAPLAERLGEERGLLAGPMRAASGLLLGAQVGALTGLLSQRVLGQYDLALLDASVPPRLLLLAPNLANAAATLGADRDELVLWVAIHEITHAVQFSGATWLREHLAGLLGELLEGLQVTLAGESKDKAAGDGKGKRGGVRRMPKLPDPNELRTLVERARRGELLRLTVGEERWRLVEQMQSAMSLIEGHAEHTMDVIGADVLPSLSRLRAAMTRRRAQRGLPWRVLERLLGLELKLKQYEVGRRFCDAVVESAGPPALARVWRAPEALPSAHELAQPSAWLARMGVSANGADAVEPGRTHVPPVTS